MGLVVNKGLVTAAVVVLLLAVIPVGLLMNRGRVVVVVVVGMRKSVSGRWVLIWVSTAVLLCCNWRRSLQQQPQQRQQHGNGRSRRRRSRRSNTA